MHKNWNLLIATAAFSLVAACDSRKEVVVDTRAVPAEATHGGAVVLLGDAGPRVEVVHDASSGTVTVYTLRDDDRVVVFEQAPVIEVTTAEGRIPVTLVRVENETHVWRATHVALKTESLAEVRLIARADGRRFEQPLAAATTAANAEPATPATPASLPPEPAPEAEGAAKPDAEPAAPAPDADRPKDAAAPVEPEPRDMPAAEKPAEPAPATAERPAPDADPKRSAEKTFTLSNGAGTVRIVRDEKTGALTVSVLDASGNALAADSVVLHLESQAKDKPTKVALVKSDGDVVAWTSSDASLAGATLAGRLVVTVGGKEHEAVLVAESKEKREVETRPAAPEGEEAAPPAPRDAPAPSNPPAGSGYRQMRPLDELAPLAEDEEPRKDDKPAPKAGTDSTGDGKTDKPKPDEEPDTKKTDAPGTSNKPADTMENEARTALEGGFLLAIAGTDDRLEVLHDKNVGKLTIQGVHGRGLISFDEAPVLFLDGEDGPTKATFDKLEGRPTVWWKMHTALKDRDVAGKVRLKIAGRLHDVDLAGPRVAAAIDEPSTSVTLGGESYVVQHDSTQGRLVFVGRTGVEDLKFFAGGPEGSLVPITLTPVVGRANAFEARHDALRSARLEGRFTGRRNGQVVEGTFTSRGAQVQPAGVAPGSGTGTQPSGTGTGTQPSGGSSGSGSTTPPSGGSTTPPSGGSTPR